MSYRRLLFAHITAENAAVCVTKVGHANTLSIKKVNERKRIEETEEVSDIRRF